MAIDRIRVNEQSSKVVTFTIWDENGDPVPDSILTTAELTLYDLLTGKASGSPMQGVINSRSDQDVLNDHDVTIDAQGVVTWAMQPEDNIIVTPRRQVERHRAMFSFTWPSASPGRSGSFDYEFEIEVVNMRKAS
jgi:hypothetical protein